MTNEELVVEIQAGKTDLINTLWEQEQKLISLLAGKFYRNFKDRCCSVGVDADDLFQDGYFALIDAVKAYDKSRGFQFNTYLSLQLKRYFYKAVKMNIKGWESQTLPVSLNAIACENKDGNAVTLEEMISDPTAEEKMTSVIEREYTQSLHDDLLKAMEPLEDRAKKIIEIHYFGVETENGNKKRLSFNEIANVLEITLGNTRRLHNKALEAMSKNKNLLEYRNDIKERYGQSYGIFRFRRLGMAPQERAILELEKRGLL